MSTEDVIIITWKVLVSITFKDFFTHLGILFIMLLTFSFGKFQSIEIIAWVCFTVICFIDIKFSFYGLFFFSSFFHSIGFLNNLPFTLKHVHIASLILAIVYICRFFSKKNLTEITKLLKWFCPLFLLFLIVVFNWYTKNQSLDYLRIPLNITLTVTLFFIAILAMVDYQNTHKVCILRRSIIFHLVGGLCLLSLAFYQSFLNSPDLLINRNYHPWGILHNNHYGALSVQLFFYSYALFFISTRRIQRITFGIITGFFFLAILASCSRTSWLAFIFGFIIFNVLVFRCVKDGKSLILKQLIRWLPLFALLTMILFFKSQFVHARIIKLFELLDYNYWVFTFHDANNFGFLGLHRLTTLKDFIRVFTEHPILGAGVTPNIANFHGSFYLILGATGIMGFIIFSSYLVILAQSLLSGIRKKTSRDVYLNIATLTFVGCWSLFSFLESYIVHFFVWINMVIALVLIRSPRSPKQFLSNCPKADNDQI